MSRHPYGLSPQQWRIFQAMRLVGRRVKSAEIADMAGITHDDVKAPAVQVRIVMAKIRQKLRPHGLTVDGVRRAGYLIVKIGEETPLARKRKMETDAARGFIVPDELETEFRFVMGKLRDNEEARKALRIERVEP